MLPAWVRLCQLSFKQQKLQGNSTPRNKAPLPVRVLSAENKDGVHFLKGHSWNYSKSYSWKEQGLDPPPSAQTCSLPLPWLEKLLPGAAPRGQPCAGGSWWAQGCAALPGVWRGHGKQEQEGQGLFRQLALRFDIQKRGMGRDALRKKALLAGGAATCCSLLQRAAQSCN